MRYVRRTLEPVVRRAAREFPVVVVTGPRQSGKTTLLRRVFGRSHRYASLELPDVRAAAEADPRAFLSHFSPPVILDEAQYAPRLLPYIKEAVDERRDRMGQYVLSGSQTLALAQGVTESLAGRAAMLRLLPLSFREMAGAPGARLPWEGGGAKAARRRGAAGDLWARLLRGGYPEIAGAPRRDVPLWHASYVQTYLERDVRAVRQVGDLGQFQTFLRALAARNAQMLNLSDLSRDLGLAVNTMKAWLSVLQATYQVIVLRPYLRNIGKRLVKTPKVYFGDLGTLCYLVGLRDPEHARSGPMAGAIFETAVLGELIRTLTHRGEDPAIYFFRTSAGDEVDFIVDTGRSLIPIEAKLSSTPTPAMARGIERFRREMGEGVARGYVVHPGDVSLPLGRDAVALPFAAL